MKPVADTLHLQKRGETWHYLRRVPRNLVALLGRTVVKRSLGVTSLADAKKLRPIEDLKVDALFAAAERGTLPAKSEALSLTALAEHVRETVEKLDKRFVQDLVEDPPEDAAQRAEMRQNVEEDLQALRDPADPNAHQSIQSKARRLAVEKGFDVETPDFPIRDFFDLVRRGLMEVDRRQLGRYTDDHSRPFYDVLFDPARPPAVTFAELADLFLAEKEQDHKANGISAKRTDKVKAAVATLREIVGDVTAARDIDDEVVQRVRTTIAKMPTNRVLVYPKLTIAHAIERGAQDGRATLNPTTQSVYLDVLRDMMKVAVRKKLLPSNPAVDVKPIVKDAVANAQKRRPWTPDQLKKFFEGEFYQSCAPGASAPYTKSDRAWRFWLPLVMLFTGARPNEICGLGIDDVRQTKAGMWFLNIGDEGDGKSLKTDASRRRVPLHPELVRIGFIAFVKERRQAKQGPRLFHELKAGPYGNLAQYPAKRLNETFIPQDVALEDRQSLYSLRHCVRDALRRTKASPETLLHVTGWSPAGKAVSDDYGDPGDPDLHAEAVAAISYPGLDLGFLHVAKAG